MRFTIEKAVRKLRNALPNVVMGSTARSGFQNLTRDRTIYKVLAHAHCPVMSLREFQTKSEPTAMERMAVHS